MWSLRFIHDHSNIQLRTDLSAGALPSFRLYFCQKVCKTTRLPANSTKTQWHYFEKWCNFLRRGWVRGSEITNMAQTASTGQKGAEIGQEINVSWAAAKEKWRYVETRLLKPTTGVRTLLMGWMTHCMYYTECIPLSPHAAVASPVFLWMLQSSVRANLASFSHRMPMIPAQCFHWIDCVVWSAELNCCFPF